ncbi:cysteine-rich secretory family protein [Pelomyxa schiedti]|nr:cysteine-rich secretory family protein [Pelomyxa schiedti]
MATNLGAAGGVYEFVKSAIPWVSRDVFDDIYSSLPPGKRDVEHVTSFLLDDSPVSVVPTSDARPYTATTPLSALSEPRTRTEPAPPIASLSTGSTPRLSPSSPDENVVVSTAHASTASNSNAAHLTSPPLETTPTCSSALSLPTSTNDGGSCETRSTSTATSTSTSASTSTNDGGSCETRTTSTALSGIGDSARATAQQDSVFDVDSYDGAALEMLSVAPPAIADDSATDVKSPSSDSHHQATEQNQALMSLQLADIRRTQHDKWAARKSIQPYSKRPSAGGPCAPNQAQRQSSPGIVGVGGDLSLWNQLKSIREDKNRQWRQTKFSQHRVWTISDLPRDEEIPPGTSDAPQRRTGVESLQTFADPLYIGREALELTNEFRKTQHLPPLAWNQKLCNIGVQHSKNMAEKRVPFGHQGFEDRTKQFGFPYRSAAENVAMNHGFSDVAKVAVDGWITSPGHRRNLVGHFNVCGIGVYQSSNGRWYLTQLFAGGR